MIIKMRKNNKIMIGLQFILPKITIYTFHKTTITIIEAIQIIRIIKEITIQMNIDSQSIYKTRI